MSSAVKMTISVSTILLPKPMPSHDPFSMSAQNSTTSLIQSYLIVTLPSSERKSVVTEGGVGIPLASETGFFEGSEV